LAIVAVGCGGGSQSPTGNSSSQSISIGGGAKVSFNGTVKPAVLNVESGISITSLAGASITGFTDYPAAVDSNSTIAYISPGFEVESYQRGASSPALDQIGTVSYGCAFGHSGLLYYAGIKGSTSDSISRSYYDGSTVANIYSSTGTDDYENVCVSPGDATIVGDLNEGGIFSMSNTGANYKVLDATGIQPCISPDGTTVAYVKPVSGKNQIFTIPIAGGTATQLSTLYPNDNFYYPCYTPDQTQLLCDVDNGSQREIDSMSVSGPNKGYIFTTYAQSTPWATHASPSPDGTYLVYASGATYGTLNTTVVISDAGENSIQTIGPGSKPTWSPFPAVRAFIGTNGAMFTSAAGLVYTQQQNGFQSLVSFQATTPADATITLESQTGSPTGGPVVYDLHADDITALKYANLYVDTPVGITVGTSDVLLTIDSNSGTVDAVAPFLATRGGKPTCVKGNGTLTYTGHFTGVWNSNGKNVAPSGATKLVLESKSGSLISAG
jgi:WD40-like Beta Propeller Repeat